jgi:hypothetical protein
MKLADAREAYDTFSKSASDSVRQLAFAAIAAVWVLKPPAAAQPQAAAHLPGMLIIAGAFAVLALAFDLSQYVYGTLAWGRFHRAKENEGVEPEGKVEAPRQINWPTNTFFGLKVGAVAFSYAFLFSQLLTQLW